MTIFIKESRYLILCQTVRLDTPGKMNVSKSLLKKPTGVGIFALLEEAQHLLHLLLPVQLLAVAQTGVIQRPDDALKGRLGLGEPLQRHETAGTPVEYGREGFLRVAHLGEGRYRLELWWEARGQYFIRISLNVPYVLKSYEMKVGVAHFRSQFSLNSTELGIVS